jgi:hypothetical protein
MLRRACVCCHRCHRFDALARNHRSPQVVIAHRLLPIGMAQHRAAGARRRPQIRASLPHSTPSIPVPDLKDRPNHILRVFRYTTHVEFCTQ